MLFTPTAENQFSFSKYLASSISIMFKGLVFCVMVVMTTVVHYSCGQCTTKYCEGDTAVVYQNLMEQNNYLVEELRNIAEDVRKNGDKIDNMKLSAECPAAAPVAPGANQNTPIQSDGAWKHCGHVYKAGYTQSGVYRIKPSASSQPLDVYCDHSNGGGWTVFQRRIDGGLLFNRPWSEYKNGFGDIRREFWMGNDLLALMSQETDSTLRVDLMDFDGNTTYAQYTNFTVQPENQNYTLQIGTYSGTAGDGGTGLSYHNGGHFSTIDRDNDNWSGTHCAKHEAFGGRGGWWYKACAHVNLNGPYKHLITGTGDRWYIVWYAWKRYQQLQKTEMRFRPADF